MRTQNIRKQSWLVARPAPQSTRLLANAHLLREVLSYKIETALLMQSVLYSESRYTRGISLDPSHREGINHFQKGEMHVALS